MRVFTVLLEVLLTVTVVAAGFLGWKLWIVDTEVAQVETARVTEVTEQWASDFENHPVITPAPTPADTAVPQPEQAGDRVWEQQYRIPKADDAIAFRLGSVIGVLYAPRLGADFKITIREGTSKEKILDKGGSGHYPHSAVLGGAGNSVITAHRSAYGSPFYNIAELRAGDRVYVETEDGWYEYLYRNTQHVTPRQVEVTNDYPGTENLGYDHLLTLISCNPKFIATERIVAYTTLVKFWPRAGGPPADVAPLVDQAPNRGVRH